MQWRVHDRTRGFFAQVVPAGACWVTKTVRCALIFAMLRFFEAVHAEYPLAPAADAPYAQWHAWSCENPEFFWGALWRFAGVIADERGGAGPWDGVVEGFERMAPPD